MRPEATQAQPKRLNERWWLPKKKPACFFFKKNTKKFSAFSKGQCDEKKRHGRRVWGSAGGFGSSFSRAVVISSECTTVAVVADV